MLLGTVGDTFADSGALMRKEEWRCYVTGSGHQTDRQEFLRAKPEKHIRAQLDVSPLSDGEWRKHFGRTGMGMSQRAHPHPTALPRSPYILISAVQVNFTLGSGRSLFNFAVSNSRLQNRVM